MTPERPTRRSAVAIVAGVTLLVAAAAAFAMLGSKPPGAFRLAWSIHMSEPARAYEVALPDDVVAVIGAATLHDVRVLDADGKLMPTSFAETTAPIGAEVDRLQCRARLEDASPGSHYRCTAYTPVESAVGLRLVLNCRDCLRIGAIDLRDGDTTIAHYVEDADARNARYEAIRPVIVFDKPWSGSALDVDAPESSPGLFSAELVRAPKPLDGTRWSEPLPAERTEGRMLVFPADFRPDAAFAQLVFPSTPDPTFRAKLASCTTITCASSEGNGEIDVLSTGPSRESWPFALGEHLDGKHALQLYGDAPLDPAIRLRIGSYVPRVRFTTAGGTAPYVLVAGTTKATPREFNARVETMRTRDPGPAATATLARYTPLGRLFSLDAWLRLLGPLLIVAGLAGGTVWAMREA
ncbi:MAG TPA: hypothetical protein VFV97_14985 [Rhodanobacteraceae bacterium]|nr:hypothetical protein [Rhodanobacteraceae bacterium]